MDTCTKSLEKFVDQDQCLKLIDELETTITANQAQANQISIAERLVEGFKRTIDKYQEQPELLEPYLPNLIARLTNNLTNCRKQNSTNIQYHTTFKYLYQLIKVTGFKSVGKRFPHETDKLPIIVDLLSKENPDDKQDWQTRFVLTVWLSIVILTPFDLNKFDAGSSNLELIANRIYSTLTRSLSSHDSCQHVTAYCLAKLFSRPDMLADGKHLNEFIRSSLNDLGLLLDAAKEGGGHTSAIGGVKLIGQIRTLAYMYKFLPRHELQKQSSSILQTVANLDIGKINGELVNHLLVKLVQRVGLALLPKRLASWRYKRGARILGIHKQQQQQQEKTTTSEAAKGVAVGQITTAVDDDDDNNEEKEVELLKHIDWLESILSLLFTAAQNGQTKIRWSAAKGIARLASRLNRQRASDVIDMVLAHFFDPQTSNEYAWHGGCLTLAEMSRQGLILEEKLELVMKVISDAIVYDKIKGSFAVGAHVREAACYVIWAMARVYDDHHIQSYTPRLSINLMCTIVFDRELQCRRAASATFQELIGRRGAFNQEALSLLANVDYQNVGVRQFAYLDLAARVSRIGGSKYYQPFIEHLLVKKLGHWDVQIRKLASESLGILMLYPSADYVESNVLNKLLDQIDQEFDINSKHGAILGLAKVIKCLVPLQYEFEDDLIELVARVCKLCDKQLKSKQQAPNFLDAICQLISAAELAQFSFEPEGEVLKQWEKLVLQALDSDNVELRNVASDAYLSLYRFYYKTNKTCQDRLLTTTNRTTRSANESSRCGAFKCLSKLGLTLSGSDLLLPTATTTTIASNDELEISNQNANSTVDKCCKDLAVQKQQQMQIFKTGGEIKLDSDTPDIILTSLIGYLGSETREKSSDQVYAQAKADCCEAFVEFVKSLDKSRLIISTHWLRAGLDALIQNTEDYTFDKRGDIGVVVRKAAVKAVQELCTHLITINMSYPLLYEAGRIQLVIAKNLQQCVSYNNAARELAAIAFYRLIDSIGHAEYRDEDSRQLQDLVPHYGEILNLLQKYQADKLDEFNWRDDSTPIFVELLGKQEYCQDLWLGLMPALGQNSELCAKQFRDALSEYIRKYLLCDEIETCREGLQNEVQRRQVHDQVFDSFLQTLERASGLLAQRPTTTTTTTTTTATLSSLAMTPTSQQRLLTTGLQTVDYLLTQGLLNETSSKFQERLVELCWQASRVSTTLQSSTKAMKPKSSTSSVGIKTTTTATSRTSNSQDPKRLVSVGRVLCSMLQFQSRSIKYKCLQYCLALLANDFAVVRANTAEQLYSNIMLQQFDGLGGNDDGEHDEQQSKEELAAAAKLGKEGENDDDDKKRQILDEAMDLLSQTQWIDPLEKVEPVREKISSCLSSYYSIDLNLNITD